MTITEFLLARIAEDEANVYAWDGDANEQIAVMWTGGEPGYTTVASGWPDDGWFADGREVKDPRHERVLYDPARMLAECEAKRRIVELHDDPEWDRCTSADHMGVLFTTDECPILRALGSVYADHPDFRDEWRL